MTPAQGMTPLVALALGFEVSVAGLDPLPAERSISSVALLLRDQVLPIVSVAVPPLGFTTTTPGTPSVRVPSVWLTAALGFGLVTPAPLAPGDAMPAPDSVLTARLATALDSSKTPRGSPLEAVLTEPVFSTDHELILPEGTTISGEVTLASGDSKQIIARTDGRRPPGKGETVRVAVKEGHAHVFSPETGERLT